MATIFTKKSKLNWSIVFKYILFFFTFIILNKACINGNIYPFSIGFYIAILWCEQNVISVSCFYLLSKLITLTSTTNYLVFVVEIIVWLFVILLHKFIKKPIKTYLIILYTIISESLFIYYSIGQKELLFYCFVSICFTIIYALGLTHFFKSILVRKTSLKMTLDEIICGCMFIVSISIGLSAFDIYGFSIFKCFAVLSILVFSLVLKNTSCILIALIIGLGNAIYAMDITSIAIFCLISTIALCFKDTNKFISSLAVILCDTILGLFFKVYTSYNYLDILPVILACFIFILLDKKEINFIKNLLGEFSAKQSAQNILCKTKDNLCNKLYEISDAFIEMNKLFKNSVKGILPIEEAKQMLIKEVVDKVCVNCKDRATCIGSATSPTLDNLTSMTKAGFEKGKVTILDVSPFLTSKCQRISIIINAINDLLNSYKQFSANVNSTDNSKMLIAEQFLGVSKLLRLLADDTSNNISIDSELENKIVDELNYGEIFAKDVIIYEHNEHIKNITLSVKGEDSNNEKITNIIGRVLNSKVEKISALPNMDTGLYTLSFKEAPKYDCIFGSCGSPKRGNKISGDSFSFLKLNQNKILLGISDGMGNGQNARKTGELAINMIENFYKAGFDNETILTSVNNLISINSQDEFSAVDLAIIDLNSGETDFIKLGAPESLIKSNDYVQTIEGTSLPLGIVEEIKPSIISKTITDNDMLILCSDGILDSFKSVEDYKSFVQSQETQNPQELAELILNHVKYHSDDATVICARIFEQH